MNMAQTNMSGLRGAGVTFPLTLTLSLGEREQSAPHFGLSDGCPAKSAARFSLRRDAILCSRGERDGVRANFTAISLPQTGLALEHS